MERVVLPEEPFQHPILKAAEAKLKRAFEDLHSLNTMEATFREGNPYAYTVHFDPESEWWVSQVEVRDDPPPDLSVLVGSIAYQCLSALNHLVWELASRKCGRRKVFTPRFKSAIQMPVALTERAFRDHPVSTRKLVSKPALAVLNSLQPYADGHGPQGPHEHPLPLIKEIADSDKHRVLAGSLGEADLAPVDFKWNSAAASGPSHEILITPGRALGDGDAVLRIRFEVGNKEANVRVDRQPEFVTQFETDRWRISVDKVGDALKWTYVKLLDFVPLFPTN